MIIDVVTYNGEKELFDLRYNILKDFVDEFIVVEFDKTFSGRDKRPSFPYSGLPKVTYAVISEPQYLKYKELAENSPNTKGAEHWKREFMQKESIKDCLTHLKDSDIVFIGDCDEIYEPECIWILWKPYKLRLSVYTYFLNNKSSEEFSGTLMSYYKNIKDSCLNELRTNSSNTMGIYGWHFTSLAPYLRQKLLDSYTEESYATKQVMDNLESNIKDSKDFLGRGFTYEIDENDLPQYLLDNRQKYEHLFSHRNI